MSLGNHERSLLGRPVPAKVLLAIQGTGKVGPVGKSAGRVLTWNNTRQVQVPRIPVGSGYHYHVDSERSIFSKIAHLPIRFLSKVRDLRSTPHQFWRKKAPLLPHPPPAFWNKVWMPETSFADVGGQDTGLVRQESPSVEGLG